VSAIILLHADDASYVEIIQEKDSYGESFNRIFDSVNDADMWLQKHAQIGWCTRIIDMDD
jgi:hypothetical protein